MLFSETCYSVCLGRFRAKYMSSYYYCDYFYILLILPHLCVKALALLWQILCRRAWAWNSSIFTAVCALCEAWFSFLLQMVFCLKVNCKLLQSISLNSCTFKRWNYYLQTHGENSKCEKRQYFCFHKGKNPRVLLGKMKNKTEKHKRYECCWETFYLLWKSKSLQSNDCGKRHGILSSFNKKRNDSNRKHRRKPNEMWWQRTMQ